MLIAIYAKTCSPPEDILRGCFRDRGSNVDDRSNLLDDGDSLGEISLDQTFHPFP